LSRERNAVADKLLECQDCGDEFILSEKEQEYCREKGIDEPVCCRDCILAREARLQDQRNERYGRR
jgi:hypothetical protein